MHATTFENECYRFPQSRQTKPRQAQCVSALLLGLEQHKDQGDEDNAWDDEEDVTESEHKCFRMVKRHGVKTTLEKRTFSVDQEMDEH